MCTEPKAVGHQCFITVGLKVRHGLVSLSQKSDQTDDGSDGHQELRAHLSWARKERQGGCLEYRAWQEACVGTELLSPWI